MNRLASGLRYPALHLLLLVVLPKGGGAAAGSFESEAAVSPEVGCPPHGAAAYVCCDGAGGFAVCGHGSGAGPVLEECVLRHETDHLRWYRENRPEACLGRRQGACTFELTVAEQSGLECRGYRIEHQCLGERRPQVARERLGTVLRRQRQLEQLAELRFGCSMEKRKVARDRRYEEGEEARSTFGAPRWTSAPLSPPRLFPHRQQRQERDSDDGHRHSGTLSHW